MVLMGGTVLLYTAIQKTAVPQGIVRVKAGHRPRPGKKGKVELLMYPQ